MSVRDPTFAIPAGPADDRRGSNGRIPTSELRGAIPNILNSARGAGVQTLQIDASFANSRLQNFVFNQVVKYGGTAASVGGRDVLTFTIGGFR